MSNNDSAPLSDAPRLVELCDVMLQPPSGPPLLSELRPLHSTPMSLTVVIGQANVSVGELMMLKEEQTLTINRAVDAAIELTHQGHVVARGRLATLGDQFALRVCETARLVP